jgi:mRNA interferase RelE/StbE
VPDYRLLITATAAKELAAVGTKKNRQRIVARIRSLARDPRPLGSQKLTAREQYRVRQGAYRIVYELDGAERTVTVFRIGHRKGVYR